MLFKVLEEAPLSQTMLPFTDATHVFMSRCVSQIGLGGSQRE